MSLETLRVHRTARSSTESDPFPFAETSQQEEPMAAGRNKTQSGRWWARIHPGDKERVGLSVHILVWGLPSQEEPLVTRERA